MTNRTEYPSPEKLAQLQRQAEQMRADAIRASFVEFTSMIKRAFSAVKHALEIPKTEQL